jgi:pimeloyl-ACP methyl ester carboxylesterase
MKTTALSLLSLLIALFASGCASPDARFLFNVERTGSAVPGRYYLVTDHPTLAAQPEYPQALACVRTALAQRGFTETTDPAAIRIYVRNKRPATMTQFSARTTLLYVHGATYPSETGFDLPLAGLSWMDFIARRGFDVYWITGQPNYDPAKITVPTLLLVGEWDRDTPPKMARTLFSLLVNAPAKRLVEIGEATHTMFMESQPYFLMAPQIVVAPGVAIALTVLAFNLLGQGLQELLDPKQRQQREGRPA